MTAEIVEVNATKLEPGHDYVLVFDLSRITMRSIMVLSKRLSEMGYNTISVAMSGPDGVKIIDFSELEKTSNDLQT